MIQKRVPPSLVQVVWTDYPAFLAACTPVVAWVVCIFLTVPRDITTHQAYATPLAAMVLLILAVVTTAAGIPVVAWRLAKIRRLFREGEEARGIIKRVVFHRDRGLVEFNYMFEGKPYYTRSYLHRNRQTRALEHATRVALLIDPDNPKQAIIWDIYH